MTDELRIDELARRAGVATTTVRLYQARRLLPPPRLQGRTGWYGEQHLARLRLIARLQADGHSLAGIGQLLDRWQRGDADPVLDGGEVELAELLAEPHATVLAPAELAARFPTDALTPAAMQRAAALRLVESTEDGRLRIPDRRFVDLGAALTHLGVPLDVVLDQWQALRAHTDEIVGGFVDVFDGHLAPAGWQDDLDAAAAHEVAATVVRLHVLARQVVTVALDASLADVGRARLDRLVDELPSG